MLLDFVDFFPNLLVGLGVLKILNVSENMFPLHMGSKATFIEKVIRKEMWGEYTPPKFNWKMMVGRLLCILGWLIFRGELLNFQGVSKIVWWRIHQAKLWGSSLSQWGNSLSRLNFRRDHMFRRKNKPFKRLYLRVQDGWGKRVPYVRVMVTYHKILEMIFPFSFLF